ncbi:MAG: hypoxanthine phosphoribosyltransferase [Clostridia bacterium]|nr:hypoxanthine phosphoribosyltransferase [Clostridia bacterium]MBR3955189.1 hypoxanthine phosphoribosyltransferase [Clostridia bacterium]
MMQDIKAVFYSEQQLQDKITEIGRQISEDYKDKNLMLVSVLKGSVVFMADLMRAITIPCEIDFMAVSSYGNKTDSSGTVRIIKDLDRDIAGYDLLIVEDILDSGMTLSYIKEILLARKPRSIRVCTLLDKPERRKSDIYADYSGFEVPNEFVVGYGLDFAQKYRNLPFIGVLKEEVYQ